MDATRTTTRDAASVSPPEDFLGWLVTHQGLAPVVAERVARVQADTADRLSGILLKLGLLSEPVLAEHLSRHICQLPRLIPAVIPVQAIDVGA